MTLTTAVLKIKFIKFFAWENHWIDRVSDARATEIKWMIKGCLNSVLFQLLWSCAPVLVSVSSFLAFVLQGNELTVGIAFTVRFSSFVPVSKLVECAQAIALFNMINFPLNIIPSWIVRLLQESGFQALQDLFLTQQYSLSD
jgi:hypothetical protein